MMWLSIAVGGALGAMARYGMVAYLFPIPSNRFPVGTLAANILGCFFIGVFYVVILEKNLLGASWRPFIISGFLGAMTTFSAFTLEAVQLWQGGSGEIALYYVAASVIGCLIATGLALYLTSQLLQ